MEQLSEEQLNKMSVKARNKYWKRLTKITNSSKSVYKTVSGRMSGSFGSRNR